MKKLENKCDCCTHECKHCGCLSKFPWELKGSFKSEGGGCSSYHAAHAGRHLEKHCNETGRHFSKKRKSEKNTKITKHEEDATVKANNFQVEIVNHAAKHKFERGRLQQKLLSKLSC